ncbi:ATP-grasp domain-containing protein [Jejuia spongiicola]|uniref:ATP-grasp domain-containing protein n=1 Tax=Jejuia spongiicola TaxID=2942207 RepID=A0ABT0QDA6_9FLAO|nr:ATP-grasp domain-containing protein [Jejuia spongiicola]MCL6294928.1 ATP-grasp domain-containing protein [Jejuia spongiicola]
MNNILITSGGRRVSLVKAFINELKLIERESSVFVADYSPNLSAAAQVADNAFKICKIEDDCYIDSLYNLCVKNDVKLIVPTLDTELLKLAESKERFLAVNIQIVISSEKLIKRSLNKLKTHELFEELGIVTAKVYSKNNFELPMFIKPINGSSSNNNHIIKSKNEISKFLLDDKSLTFFEYLDHDVYDEYTCDLYYSKLGTLKCVIPRKRIEIRAGEVSKGVTIKNEVKSLINEKLASLEGARGCITLQLFLHKESKEIKGIEINPRFGGGFPLSYLAGGNYPKWIIQEYLFNKEISYFDDWEENLLMLRYDSEILIKNHED